jgi:hypothetical protein
MITPIIGNTGTNGTLNPLLHQDWVFYLTITPTHTKANSVPILTIVLGLIQTKPKCTKSKRRSFYMEFIFACSKIENLGMSINTHAI